MVKLNHESNLKQKTVIWDRGPGMRSILKILILISPQYSKTCLRKPPLNLTLVADVERWLSYKGTCHVILLAKLHDMYLYKTDNFFHINHYLKSVSKVALLHRFHSNIICFKKIFCGELIWSASREVPQRVICNEFSTKIYVVVTGYISSTSVRCFLWAPLIYFYVVRHF